MRRRTAGVGTFQCTRTKDCRNSQCFYKQRDCYGRSPWGHPGVGEEIIAAIEKVHGECIFPSLTVSHGTNCMYIFCQEADVDEPNSCGPLLEVRNNE